MVIRSFLPFALTVVLSTALVPPRCLAQAAPAGKTTADATAWPVFEYRETESASAQRQACDEAAKAFLSVWNSSGRSSLLDAVENDKWDSIPADELQNALTFYAAMIRRDKSCLAVVLNEHGQNLGKRLESARGLAHDLDHAWDRWAKLAQLAAIHEVAGRAALPWGSAENAQRACGEAQQDLSRLAIQSDPSTLRAAYETSYGQIPNSKTSEALDYYYGHASVAYTCGMAAFARGEFGPAEGSFSESATYATRALNFAIQRFNQLVRNYDKLSDGYDELAKDDAKAWKLVDLADRVIREDSIALSVADRALLTQPSFSMPVFVHEAPMPPIELRCVTTTSHFGTGATAYTNCY
jgi:hypothetical protein